MLERTRVYKSPLPPLDELVKGNAVDIVSGSPYAEATRDKVVMIDAKTGEKLTGEEEYNGTRKLASVLREKYDLQKDKVACVFTANSIYTRSIYHAVLTLGAIVSPASPLYSVTDLAHQLKTTQARLLIADDALLSLAMEAAELAGTNTIIVDHSAIVEDFKAALKSSKVPFTEPVTVDGADQHAFYCFSSGTTGLPKCVITTHQNIATNTLQVLQVDSPFGNTDAVVAACLPMSHIFGLQMYLWTGAVVRSKHVVFQGFDLETFLRATKAEGISTVAAVPPMVLLLAKSPLVEKYPSESLRFLATGAAPISKSVIGILEKRLPNLEIFQMYGLTETSPIVLSAFGKKAGAFTAYDQNSVGWLVPSTEARIIDPTTLEDSRTEEGELWIKGPQVCKGYLHNPQATAELLPGGGWMRTGDVARVDSHGQIYIVDRIKELIKSKGFQVAPAELEALLLKDRQVRDVAVIGVADEASELPRAYLVLRDGGDAHGVVRRFNSQVARYKRLWGGVVLVQAIPKSPSGKILRRLLKAESSKHHPIGQELAKSTGSAKL